MNPLSQQQREDVAQVTSGETPELRIGTRERENVVRRLMRHQGMGRLTAEEYYERIARARGAVVASDLDGLLDDLEPSDEQ